MEITEGFHTKALLMGILLLAFTHKAAAQYTYQNEPVLHIIKNIRKQTSFRFLYRDALIADISLTFSSDKDHIWQDFRKALRPWSLNLKVNKKRKQAIIYRRINESTTSKKVLIHGQVVDATTGERLPFANIFWSKNGNLNGVSANKSGAFTIKRNFKQPSITIRCSYVGYKPQTITLDFTNTTSIHELTFRLQPKQVSIGKLLVVGQSNTGNLNKQSANLVNIGTFSPMGESSTMRALQSLPSVSLSPAMSGGVNVRGSPTDGFHVLLDGITIFNQTHLFGMIDSFNADVLQRSAFFYDIVPAKYPATPGGTLLLLTKTGSMRNISGSAGLSNSSVRFSLSGPIKKGKSSWLISARKSYMNTINWFNNNQLIRRGLDVNRSHNLLGSGLIDFQSYLVRPQKAVGSFYDLHGKLYFEGKNGNRLILSGYYGGDNTQLDAQHLFRSFSTGGGNGFTYRPVTSKNKWHNGAATIQFQHWFNGHIYSSTLAGFSIYKTSFSKDDFTYLQIDPIDQSLRAFVFPFKNKSVMNLIKVKQAFEFYWGSWKSSAGLAYKYYLGEYLEKSFNRPGYFSKKSTNQIDLFAQVNQTGWEVLNFFTGLRVHYYSNGHYLRFSPRIKFKLFPESDVSLGAGFSRNYQFLNQISLRNAVTSNVWILAGEGQPPVSVNYFSAGAYFDINKYLYAQVEGYIKKFKNLRLHELNTFSLSNTFNSNPWFSNNSGKGKGLEFLVSAGASFLSLTQTFTVSSIMLTNPNIHHGKPFYAQWDRKYNYTAVLEAHPLDHFSLYLSWMFATGKPNWLATFGPENKKRLDNYRRADLSVKYKHVFQSARITVAASLFNVFNRSNPWYSDLAIAIDENTTPKQFRAAPLVVYDIGFQPSFNITVHF